MNTKELFLDEGHRDTKAIGNLVVTELSAKNRADVFELIDELKSLNTSSVQINTYVKTLIVSLSVLDDDGNVLFDINKKDDLLSLTSISPDKFDNIFLAACELSGFESFIGKESKKD